MAGCGVVEEIGEFTFFPKMEEICVHYQVCKLSYLYILSGGALSHRAKPFWRILQNTHGGTALHAQKKGEKGGRVHLQVNLTGWEREAEGNPT